MPPVGAADVLATSCSCGGSRKNGALSSLTTLKLTSLGHGMKMEKVPMKSDEYNEFRCRMLSNEGGTLARWEVKVDPIAGRDKRNRISHLSPSLEYFPLN